MSRSLDLFADAREASALHWPEVRAWLQENAWRLAEDRALLEELGLKLQGRNVVDFGRAALARLEAVVEREAGARKQIEQVARANFAAQSQTHAAVLELMEARNHADLARRLDRVAQERFGLARAVAALEKPGGVPFGWKPLEAGTVDLLFGFDGLTRLGPAGETAELFGADADTIKSVALIRMAPLTPSQQTARHAVCAFGSGDLEGFTPDMGCELAAFVARVVERMAERWPVME